MARVKVRSGGEHVNPGLHAPVAAAPAIAPPAKPAGKPIINCYWAGESVVLVHPDRSQTRTRARFSLFCRSEDLPDDTLRQLKGSRAVRAITKDVGGWSRIECPDLDYRHKLVSTRFAAT